MTSPQSETSISQWDTLSDSDTVFEDVYEMFDVIAKLVCYGRDSSTQLSSLHHMHIAC